MGSVWPQTVPTVCRGFLQEQQAQLAARGRADDPGSPGKAAALTQLLSLLFTVAALTAKIRTLEEHLQRHPKDKSNRRCMLMDLDRRRKMLGYLRRVNYSTFEKTCKQLDIQYSPPQPYARRITKRWLVKKALCIKVFQEKQKLKAAERLKQRRQRQARARAAREQQEQQAQKQAQEGTPV
ncbi:28S ribosomal protein S15, mitochondrial-like [Malurus melanocephalus]|uniref:28S ribosomal protein S15, mitochondrial-like n=1 Tax=Malurus melanocephalus TaxID=175006 RepID=UPI002549889B|nr:28S ribosomal protein S15, mitochondrial-like [Malurus melanocephalus]XP_057245322.1 28S ribosomal protein S15, mitochondrial-like [Malurus melanocephalus]